MRLTEIKREVFGDDERAINRHSQRVYRTKQGLEVALDRNLSGLPPFFKIIGPVSTDFVGFCPTVKVNGYECWGTGFTWKKAIATMCETLNAEIV